MGISRMLAVAAIGALSVAGPAALSTSASASVASPAVLHWADEGWYQDLVNCEAEGDWYEQYDSAYTYECLAENPGDELWVAWQQ